MSLTSGVTCIEGGLEAKGLRFGVVVARFNSFITEKLLDGALAELIGHGANPTDITVVKVPGSFELPLAARKLAESGQFEAIIALGAVIRGATSHYDLVCGEAATGLGRVSAETGVPVGFGVVTTNNVEQALERAGLKGSVRGDNKGSEAALVAIEMARLVKKLSNHA